MNHPYTIAALIFAASALPVLAQVTVTEPWVRGTVPSQKATGAFMQLKSGQEAKLVEARSPVAGIVEVHKMTMKDGVMSMRAIPVLPLPAGKVIELTPGGYHVMLLDLNKQLKEGETVPITLVIEGADMKRQTLEVKAPVKALTTRANNSEQKR